MDIERALISKVIQTRQAETVIARGIEIDHFADNESRDVWETVLDHMRRYKSPPSLEAVKTKHETFQLQLSQDALDYLIDQFIVAVKRRKAIEVGRDFMAAIDDPDRLPDIEVTALDMARNLTEIVPAPRASRYSEMEQRIDKYMERKESDDPMGIRMGVPTFDHETLGIQPHELVTVAAFLGTGKSTFMQHIFFEAYLQGKTPMLISLEMEAEALFRKWDVMATQVQYRALKALELGEGDIEKWKQVAEKASEAKPEKDIIVVDDIINCTPDRVLAETMRYKPDMIGVDFINVMRAPKMYNQMWERLLFIAYELKHNARVTKIPVVAAAQGNRQSAREGVTLDTVANSIGIAQASDICVALHQDEDDYEAKRMQLGLIKNRDGKKPNVVMHWEHDIMDFHEITPDEIMQRGV